MKLLILSLLIVSSNILNAGYLLPKYECLFIDEDSGEILKGKIHVTEDYLCGDIGSETEAAMYTEATENDPLSTITIGKISAEDNGLITYKIIVKLDGKTYIQSIQIKNFASGKNNSTASILIDIDQNAKPVYYQMSGTCSPSIFYDMDCP